LQMRAYSTRSQSAFIGALTADATHELNNMLAIIRESAGLIQDLVNMADRKLPSQTETVQRCLNTIEQQIVKGVGLLNSLNRLAHCPDHTAADVVVTEAADQLIRLCSRAAARQHARLSLKETGDRPTLSTEPVLFRMLLYTALQICLEALSGPGEITIGFSTADGSVIVDVSASSDDPAERPVSFSREDAPLFENLSALLEKLSGSADSLGRDNLIRLFLPFTPTESDS